MSKIHIFGDSHSRAFRLLSPRGGYTSKYFSGDEVSVNVYQAASMKGFGKRDSTLSVREDILSKVSNGDTVALAFGQVDLELGWYYSLVVKQEDITLRRFLRACLESYDVLRKELTEKNCNIVIKGINYPVLLDSIKAKRYVGRIVTEAFDNDKEIKKYLLLLDNKYPEVFTRIRHVNLFNQLLEDFSLSNSLKYYDINSSIASELGIIHEKYIPASFDHHLVDSIETRLIYQKALFEAIHSK